MDTDLHPGRHFFLYAKHRYWGSNDLEAVRRITADYTGSYPQHISDNDVLAVICDIALPYLLEKDNSVQRVQEIFCKLINTSRVEGRPLTVKDVVLQMLSILAAERVRDADGNELIKLGEPDLASLCFEAEI